MPHQQPSRHDLIEPRQVALIGVAAVTILLKDLIYRMRNLNLSGCGGRKRNGWTKELKRTKNQETDSAEFRHSPHWTPTLMEKSEVEHRGSVRDARIAHSRPSNARQL